MNKVIIIGNLIRDVELKAMPNGTEVCNFTIAVRRNFQNSNGDYESDFINCVSYKKTAEIISRYTKKGDKLAVEGRINTRNYEKDGHKIYITEIIVENIQFLTPKQKEVKKDEFEEEANKVKNTDNDLPW